MQIHVQQLGPGMIQQIQSACSDCRGTGERINPKDRCKHCNGKKVSVSENKILIITVLDIFIF